MSNIAVCQSVPSCSGRFKEKNRTAQKRYRERQKSKLQESEEKVAELTEQLNSLKVEKVGRRQLSCKPH